MPQTLRLKLQRSDVFYINLDRETDKRISTEKMLAKNGFRSVTRISAFDREKVAGSNTWEYMPTELTFKHSVAVAHSHLKALSSIKRLPAIILEDDLVLRYLPKRLEVPLNADALFLGTSPMTLRDEANGFRSSFFDWETQWVQFDKSVGTEDCYRLYGMLGGYSTAYITDRYVKEAIDAFTESADTGIPIDVIQRRMQEGLNTYVTSRSIFVPWNVGYGAIDLQSFVPPITVPQILYDV